MSTVNGGWRGPNIVKDGLVLYLDAGSPNSYFLATAGTTWRDMSGFGNNGILTNGSTFDSSNGGNIVFDGIDDSVNLGLFQSFTNSFTISVNCRVTANFGNIFGFYATSRPFNGWGLAYGQNPARDVFLNFWDGVSWRNPNIIVRDGVWRNITVTSLLSFFINGVFITSIQGASILPYTENKSIGARPDSAGSITGNISTALIYNRVLSNQEVSQNFNATRSRFGI